MYLIILSVLSSSNLSKWTGVKLLIVKHQFLDFSDMASGKLVVLRKYAVVLLVSRSFSYIQNPIGKIVGLPTANEKQVKRS